MLFLLMFLLLMLILLMLVLLMCLLMKFSLLYLQASIKVSSTENGIIFGNIG